MSDAEPLIIMDTDGTEYRARPPNEWTDEEVATFHQLMAEDEQLDAPQASADPDVVLAAIAQRRRIRAATLAIIVPDMPSDRVAALGARGQHALLEWYCNQPLDWQRLRTGSLAQVIRATSA